MPALHLPLPHELERIRLRRLRVDDLDAFHAYRSDATVARYQGWAPMTRAEAADFLRREAAPIEHEPDTWRQLGIAERVGDVLVGDVGLWLSADGRQVEFGISIASEMQGRGYGTECVRGLIALVFASSDVEESIAATDERNAPCLAMLARAGMRETGTRAGEYKGEWCTERRFTVRRRSV